MILENQIPSNIRQVKAAVVTFVQPGCGHCHAYLPVFKRVGSRYAHCLPVIIMDVTRPEFGPVADFFRVEATPTTVVLFRGRKNTVVSGALNDTDLEALFRLAVRGLSCELG